MRIEQWKTHLLSFDKEEHLYSAQIMGDGGELAPGVPVPGVTTVLKVLAKEALYPWIAKMASEYSFDKVFEKVQRGQPITFEFLAEVRKGAKVAHKNFATKAADIGTEVHAYAEAVLNGTDLPTLSTPQARNGADAFESWLSKNKIEVLEAEKLIFSKRFWYAGTADLYARVNGKLCVLDWKTSTGIWPEYRFQVAAYVQGIQEELGVSIDSYWVLRFDKVTGKFEEKEFRQFQRDFHEGFVPCLTLYRTLREIKERK